MSTQHDLEEILGEVASFTYGARLAAEGLREPRARNSLCLMMDTIDERLNAARSIIDQIRDADDLKRAR